MKIYKQKLIKRLLFFSFLLVNLVFVCNMFYSNNYNSRFIGSRNSIRTAGWKSERVYPYYFEKVFISSDGNIIMARTSHTVFLFNKSSPKPIWNYSMNHYMHDQAITPNGNYFVVVDNENQVFFFENSSSTPLWVSTIDEDNSVITSVALSHDGQYIVVGYNRGNIYLLNSSSVTAIWNYNTDEFINDVAISSEGKYIIAGTRENLYLFNSTNPTPTWKIRLESPVLEVAISSDNNYVIARNTYQLYLFNRSNLTPLWNSSLSTSSLRSMAISSLASYLVVVGLNSPHGSQVFLFNKSSSRPMWSCETDNIISVAISSSGSDILVANEERKLLLFNKNSSTPIWEYRTFGIARSVSISSDGSFFVAGCEDGRLYFFDKDKIFSKDSNDSLVLILSILIPIIVSLVIISSFLINRYKKLQITKQQAIETQVITDLGDKKPSLKYLKCVRCGLINDNLLQYKKLVPVCDKCRKKFNVLRYGNILLTVIIPISIVIVAFVIFYLYLIMVIWTKYNPPHGMNEPWREAWIGFITTYPIAILMAAIVIGLILLQIIYGSRPKKYLKYDNGFYIKSQTDTEWIVYRDWMRAILIERNVPEPEITTFIEEETKKQLAIEMKYKKKCKRFVSYGRFLIFIGIISIVYGFIVTIIGNAPQFFIIHLASGGVPLFYGIFFFVYGKHRNIF